MRFNFDLVDDISLQREYTGGSRFYLTPDGKRYPSVTTVLGQLSEEGIATWRKNVGDEEADRISKESSTIGTAMHQICENYLLDEPLPTDNEKATELFNILKPSIDKIQVIHGIELPMYSDYLQLAGTADLVATYDDTLCILDFKNARKPKIEDWVDGYYLQGATYARMFFEMYGQFPEKIVIWIAVWDGSFQEFIIKPKDIYPRLKAVLKMYHPAFRKV